MISSGSISLSTVQRFIQKQGLNKPRTELKDRRAFEMELPGDCWQTDISMGPYLTINGAVRDSSFRTYGLLFTTKTLLCYANWDFNKEGAEQAPMIDSGQNL